MSGQGNCMRGCWTVQNTWKSGLALPSLRQQWHQRKNLGHKKKAGSLILTGYWQKWRNEWINPEVSLLQWDQFNVLSCTISGHQRSNGWLKCTLILSIWWSSNFWESFWKLANDSTWPERGESYVAWGMAGYRAQLCRPWWCGSCTKEDATESEEKAAHLCRRWDTCRVWSFILI